MTLPAALLRPADAASMLLVDDDRAILDGTSRRLRKKFTVHTATGTVAGLEVLACEPVAVVTTDVRMPPSDGATFRGTLHAQSPDMVRLLLTGQSDTQAAITAANEFQAREVETTHASVLEDGEPPRAVEVLDLHAGMDRLRRCVHHRRGAAGRPGNRRHRAPDRPVGELHIAAARQRPLPGPGPSRP